MYSKDLYNQGRSDPLLFGFILFVDPILFCPANIHANNITTLLCFCFVLEPRKRHELQALDPYIIKAAQKSSKRICSAAVIATNPSLERVILNSISCFIQEKNPTDAHFAAKCLLIRQILMSILESTLEKNHIAVRYVLNHIQNRVICKII
jgi:hypothetical protein